VSSRLYKGTALGRRTVSQAQVQTIVGIDPSAPDGSYRLITVFGPASPILYCLDAATEEQLSQEQSVGAEIGEGLTQTEWPEVATSVPWSARLQPDQRLRALAKPGSGAGIVHITVKIEYRLIVEG